jgi:hypothetical protein
LKNKKRKKEMLWSEVRKWAKDKGFDIVKEKDDSINGASYYWMKTDNHSISGVSLSVSKLARDIFNVITDNKWVEHQKKFEEEKEHKKFTLNDYGS